MHHTIIRRTKNSPGKPDATGAFIPASKRLRELLLEHGDSVELLDLESKEAKKILRSETPTDTLSVFCHGWPRRVEALPRWRLGAIKTARWMQRVGCEQLNLFACNAADHDGKKGNYSQMVAEACHEIGHIAQVFGHETSGHTTWNPNARFYWATPQGVTTEDLMPEHPDDREAWIERMKNDQEYRLLLPFIFDNDEE